MNAMQYGSKLPDDMLVKVLSLTGSKTHPLSRVAGVTQRRIRQSRQADWKRAPPFVMGGGSRQRDHVDVHDQRSLLLIQRRDSRHWSTAQCAGNRLPAAFVLTLLRPWIHARSILSQAYVHEIMTRIYHHVWHVYVIAGTIVKYG